MHLVRDDVDASTRSPPRIATGERRKRSSIMRRAPSPRSAVAYSRSRSTLRRAVNVPSSSEPRGRHRVQLGVAGSDDDVDAVHAAQLAQLRVRERGLRRPAAAEHDDAAYRALAQRGERVVGDVGARQLVGVAGEEPRDIGRDVAVADDDRGLVRQIGREVAEVRVAVVPADERGRGQAAGQVLTRGCRGAVRLRAHGVDHRVVAAHEIRVGHGGADLDVAEEPAAAAQDAAREASRPGA